MEAAAEEKRLIIVADDIAANRILLKGIFRREYRVEEASNGFEVMEKLYALPDVAALVLDIRMPKMDGFEVLSRMQQDKRLRSIPTVVVTGSDDDETQIRALQSGATDVQNKPINSQVVLHRMRNILARKEADRLAEQNRAMELELHLLDTDDKSGLYNKNAFIRHTTRLLRENTDKRYVVICWDIDNFKVCNDQFGTQIGDEYLYGIGDYYRNHARNIPGLLKYARMEADRFVCCYEAAAFDPEQTLAALHAHTESIMTVAFKCVPRIGLYHVDDPTVDVALMCDRALLALRSVKNRYDRFYAWFDDSMRKEIIEEQEIINEMQPALEQGQFKAYLQPQYNHETGLMLGAEALVRWLHPEKGLIPPYKFIPLFEKNGFIFELDKCIWEQVCVLLRSWIDEGITPLPISVNVSRFDMFQETFYAAVTDLVEKYRIPPELLRLEITESAFAKSTELIIEMVSKLRAYGFLIEIDDFGCGYSSFNTLKDVPAHILKLDMKFLENGGNRDRGAKILESIISMADSLEMPVIAEGVETKEQADFLQSIGCTSIQGYYYAKPMPVADCEALYRKQLAGERG